MQENLLFTLPLDNTLPETIANAKRQMYNCATDMGFVYHDEFQIEQYKDVDSGTEPYRLNALFYSKPPALIIPG